METCVLAGDNRHLAVCRPCKARFDELVRSLQQMHDAAVREADDAFTADRLHDQRDRIMRRIERHDHPAEVVAFPHQRVPAASDACIACSVPRAAGSRAPRRRASPPGVFLGFAMDRSSHLRADRSGRSAVRTPTRRWRCRLRPTISSSSRSTRRWSARARARCAPISSAIDHDDDPARNPRSQLRSRSE